MRCINWKLTASLTFCLLIGASWALATGTLTLPANPVYNLISNGGIPSGGFRAGGTETSTGGVGSCVIQAAGGNLGTFVDLNTPRGANFDISCDSVEAGSYAGTYFRITDTNVGGGESKFEVLAVKGDNMTYVNGLDVQPQTISSGQPNPFYYRQFFRKTSKSRSMFTVHTDQPSDTIPVASTWGGIRVVLGNQLFPLWQNYGSVFFNSAQYDALTSTPTDGILVSEQMDNGNYFSNQLTRTTAAYTNATTTLGILSTTSGSGALTAPILSGRTYDFHGKIYITTATGGIKLAINSNSTVSAIRYDVRCTDYATTAVVGAGFATSLGTAAGATSTNFTGGGMCEIDGTATMSAGSNYTITMDCANASAVCTTTSTTDVEAGQLVTHRGNNCDAIAPNSYVVSFVPNTSITLSRNAQCEAASTTYLFMDALWVEAASNAAGTLTVAQGSSFEVKGSLNGGAL